MAQLVEHILGKDEVTGSSPVISSKDRDAYHLCLFLFIGKRKIWTGDTRLQILRTKRAKNL